MNRFIVVWRKRPPESPLEWDQHFCMDLQEVERVVKNIKAQGVHQYRTYPIGEKLDEHSSTY